MQVQDRTAIVGIALGAAGTVAAMALPFAYPDAPIWLWRLLFWGGASAFIFGFLVLLYDYAFRHLYKDNHRHAIPQYTSLAIIVFLGFIIYLYPPQLHPNPLPAEVDQYDWGWPPLNKDQFSRACNKLRAIPTLSEIRITRETYADNNLRNSLDSLFRCAGLGVESGYNGPIMSQSTGLTIYPDNESTNNFKKILEDNSTLTFSPGTSPRRPQNKGLIVINIGTKTMLEPLPAKMALEMQSVGQTLVEFSNATHDFASDRDREKDELMRQSPPASSPNQACELWRDEGNFDMETGSIFKTKFGQDMTNVITKLSFLGIVYPWSLMNAEERPNAIAIWFGVVGKYLVDGKINAARTVAADGPFWFDLH